MKKTCEVVNISALIIHARWPIEEYASRARKWDWFIPPNPPINAPAIHIRAMYLDDIENAVDSKRQSGATFCQVARIRQFNQGSPLMTWGSHQCIGAAPSFNIRLRVSVAYRMWESTGIV